ncbi:MAG: hypothetical protein QNJ30_13225 [Kiloniellales bacterium]|nr:hypothetical protein [Kiloniellales bacterium]
MVSNSGKSLKADPIVKHLVPDPSIVPDVRVLIGFLGKSSRDKHWRLYVNPTFDDYLEFGEADVVHCHSLEADANRLGGSVVWIKREANVHRTRTSSREAQADFLHGAIAARASRRTLAPGIADAILAWRPGGGFQPGSIAVHVSCVREFCDFAPVSFLGGGDVYCTGSFQCDSTWQAECP